MYFFGDDEIMVNCFHRTILFLPKVYHLKVRGLFTLISELLVIIFPAL